MCYFAQVRAIRLLASSAAHLSRVMGTILFLGVGGVRLRVIVVIARGVFGRHGEPALIRTEDLVLEHWNCRRRIADES